MALQGLSLYLEFLFLFYAFILLSFFKTNLVRQRKSMTENFKMCLQSLMKTVIETQKLRVLQRTKLTKIINFLHHVLNSHLISFSSLIGLSVPWLSSVSSVLLSVLSDIHFGDTVDLAVYKLGTIFVDTRTVPVQLQCCDEG